MAAATKPVAGEPRSQRGRNAHSAQVLTPLQQIPVMPGNAQYKVTGAWSYYLRPDGATISDILILYPNGGIPDMDDPKQRARFGQNAELYQQAQRRKGFEYIGQTLTEQGITRLVEIMAENRSDEVLFCEDEVVNCEATIKNSDRPEIRDQARRRKAQFQRRLDYLNQPFDPDALLQELKDIARAQMLANVDPNVLRVMRAMIGEVNDRVTGMVGHFQAGIGTAADSPIRASAGEGTMGAEFEGKAEVSRD